MPWGQPGGGEGDVEVVADEVLVGYRQSFRCIGGGAVGLVEGDEQPGPTGPEEGGYLAQSPDEGRRRAVVHGRR